MVSHTLVHKFSNAIVRQPASTVVHGLRADDRGNPDFEKVSAEHDAYVAALTEAGVRVEVLPADEEFPDSMFVEDPALVFSEGAVLLRPGAASRFGEAAKIKPVLDDTFSHVFAMTSEGTAEGGDVLVLPDAVMIGLSSRTNFAGATSVVECLKKLGRRGEIVETPPGVLHFKTECSLLDEETILTTAQLAASGVFQKFKMIIVPADEVAAANALRVNDVVMVGAGFPRTIELLDKRGYSVVALNTCEIGKIDAGLSCMSLRWQCKAGK